MIPCNLVLYNVLIFDLVQGGQTESEKILGSRFMMHWIQKTKYQVESLVVNKNQLEL